MIDFSVYYPYIFNWIGFMVVLVLVSGVFKSARFKGWFGEFLVRRSLKYRLDNQLYHCIHDVTLRTADGTTQIDHIVVSQYGVFVIETKNFKGWIFGNKHQKQWRQQIFRHKSQFQNPLRQNYKHLKTLEQSLVINSNVLFSLVVFVGNCEFKTPMPDNVTYLGGCVPYIKSKQQVLLSPWDVEQIIKVINSGRLARGLKTNQAHVKHVKQLVEDKNTADACPKCGSAMMLRTAKKGKNSGQEFWGCSTFPRCRAMVDL